MWFYGVARLALRVLLPLQMRLRVVGAERCPASGPLIIVTNHLGLFDPLVVGVRLPRRIRILAKAEVFGWFFVGWVARHTGVVAVRRGASDREALRTLAGAFAGGGCVLLLPEGTYPKPPLPPAMLPTKTGAAFLALRSGAPVLPAGVTGTERVWVPGRAWRPWRRPRVTVTFGEPYRPQPPAGVPLKLAYQAVTDDMACRIAALLPPAYRGYYGEASVARYEGEMAEGRSPLGGMGGRDTPSN